MNRDEQQGRQLIALGWATQDLVNQAWHAPRQAHHDLCEVLLAWGRISPEQAAHVRQSAQQSSSASSSSTGFAAQPIPGPPGSAQLPSTVGGSQGLELRRNQERDWSLGVGPYAIVREISRGGMGIVFHAKHKQSGQEAALKVMLSSEASETDKTRFEREAQALQGFTHPNIVRFYDSGIDPQGQEPYFAMELVKGRDLKEVIESHKKAHGAMPDLPWMLRVLKPIASALARCHEKKIIHRDLKPQNILIEEATQRPVLVDFGLVKRSKTEGENFEHSLTKQGDVLGTPAYMAPEQLDPEEFGKPDSLTDTWGFGGILLYCLTGQAPYQGSTNFNIYKKVMTESPPRPRSLNSEVPPWLDELCAQCFQRDRKKRPSMAQVVEDLEQDLQDFSGGEASKSKLLIIVGAILILLVSILSFTMLGGSPQKLTALSPTSTVYTKADKFTLELQLMNEEALILEKQNGQEWVSDPANGAVTKSPLFRSYSVALEEGLNLFRARPQDSSPESAIHFKIYRDQKAPVVQFSKTCKVWDDVLYYDQKGALQGTVQDDSPVTFTIQGGEISLEKGEFRALLKDPASLSSITVLAKDKAGHEWRGNFQLRPLSTKKIYEALLDRKKWNRLSPKEQDLVAKEVGRRLGSGFQSITSKRYSSGGQAHRIPSFRHKASGIQLALLPGGAFYMGVQDDEAELRYCREQISQIQAELARMKRPNFALGQVKFTESSFNSARPYHRVTVQPFLMARHVVSKRHWDQGKVKTRARMPADWPMVFMTFLQIKEWLKGWKTLRLPSEAEWEYACRAGTSTRYYWGDQFVSTYCWSWRNNDVLKRSRGPWLKSIYAHEKQCNAFGLVDMLGHVWEMCEDEYFGSYKGAPNDGRPRLRKGPRKNFVRRGGGALYGGSLFARSACRGKDKVETATNSTGFRVAVSIPGLKRPQQ